MATEKPRITITLEPAEYAVLSRLAKLQGSSMSRILREFMGEVTPILSKVADSLEVAKRASADARAKFVKAAEVAEEELRPLVEFSRSQFDMFAAELQRIVDTGEEHQAEETGAGRAARGARSATGAGGAAQASKGKNPRPVITGVTEVQRGTGQGKGKAGRAVAKSASPRAK
jgi:hypothetical protein